MEVLDTELNPRHINKIETPLFVNPGQYLILAFKSQGKTRSIASLLKEG